MPHLSLRLSPGPRNSERALFSPLSFSLILEKRSLPDNDRREGRIQMSGRIQEGCRKAVILSRRDPRRMLGSLPDFVPHSLLFCDLWGKKNRQIYIFSPPTSDHLTNSFPDSPAATVFQSLESKCSLSIVYTLGEGKEDLSTQTCGVLHACSCGPETEAKEAKDKSFLF